MQAGNADIFAAAGFKPKQEGQHGAQLLSCLMRRIGKLTIGKIAVQDAPDGRPVSQVQATTFGQVDDYPAQGREIFARLRYPWNWTVHVYPFPWCESLVRFLVRFQRWNVGPLIRESE
jgi:hypothetical protein